MAISAVRRSARVALFLLGVAFVARADGSVTRLGPLIGSPQGVDSGKRASLADTRSPWLSPNERVSLGPLNVLERQRLLEVKPDFAESATTIGIVRQLPRSVRFDGAGLDVTSEQPRAHFGGVVESDGAHHFWTTAIRSEGAGALRLELTGTLPSDARAYIYTKQGEVHGPYSATHLAGGSFWTNTVFAVEAFLEVQVFGEASRARLEVASVLHVEHESFLRAGSDQFEQDDCLLDVACVPPGDFPNLAAASRSVALLVFVEDGRGSQCSGALLNNVAQDATPYLLTAKHCFETPDAAATVEAIWRYRTTDCDDPGLTPGREFAPRSLGSTLLATGRASDFTFVRLNEPAPPDAVFLGWDGETNIALAAGTPLFRVSHPQSRVQHYSRHRVSSVSCPNQKAGPLIFSIDERGTTLGGSSGSPLMLENLVMVGQLRGWCVAGVINPCKIGSLTVDGSFRTAFIQVSEFLTAPAGEPFAPSIPPGREKRRSVRH